MWLDDLMPESTKKKKEDARKKKEAEAKLVEVQHSWIVFMLFFTFRCFFVIKVMFVLQKRLVSVVDACFILAPIGKSNLNLLFAYNSDRQLRWPSGIERLSLEL